MISLSPTSLTFLMRFASNCCLFDPPHPSSPRAPFCFGEKVSHAYLLPETSSVYPKTPHPHLTAHCSLSSHLGEQSNGSHFLAVKWTQEKMSGLAVQLTEKMNRSGLRRNQRWHIGKQTFLSNKQLSISSQHPTFFAGK